MTVQVSYKNKISSNNIVLFVDHIFNTKPIEKYLTKIELNYINGLIKQKDLKKNFHLFEINSKKKIILISLKKNLEAFEIENLGAEFYNFIKTKTNRDVRELMVEENVKTTLNYVCKKGWMKEANEWFHRTGNEKGAKYSDHAIMKFADGKGVWDGSVHVFGEYMNAVIGRNMVDTMHPTEERSLTIREALHMMGFPENFELLHGLKKMIVESFPSNITY